MARRPTILFVAGDRITRRMVADGLAVFDYEVITAADGEEAAEALRRRPHIGLLVTDADLQGQVDGLAVARLAREVNPSVDVIYTSITPHRVREKAKVNGAPTMRSPFSTHQLVGVITNLRYRQSAEKMERSAA